MTVAAQRQGSRSGENWGFMGLLGNSDLYLKLFDWL